MVRGLRNEHMSLFKCAAFLAEGQLLSVGMHSGEVRPRPVAAPPPDRSCMQVLRPRLSGQQAQRQRSSRGPLPLCCRLCGSSRMPSALLRTHNEGSEGRRVLGSAAVHRAGPRLSQVRLYHLESGEVVAAGSDAHSAPVSLLQSHSLPGGRPALLSSSRQAPPPPPFPPRPAFPKAGVQSYLLPHYGSFSTMEA